VAAILSVLIQLCVKSLPAIASRSGKAGGHLEIEFLTVWTSEPNKK
jgi:hypothetical protein